MALLVQINRRVSNNKLGTIQADNASYYDPITGVNLNRGNPLSADLSAFSSSQLQNISNAVYLGTLTLVSGSLPAASLQGSIKEYSLWHSHGAATGGVGEGITTVAAADALENNFS